MPAPAPRTVLHYTGADDDRGGVMSVVKALAGVSEFESVLGVNPAFVQRREPLLPVLEFPRIATETIGLRSLWQARRVARAARQWLAADERRVFHAHSRAGLLVAWWLDRHNARRVVVSVHCYGRQRWFYRLAAWQFGARIFWLSPAMKEHYGLNGTKDWTQCIPGCIPEPRPVSAIRRRGNTVRLGGIGAFVRWKRWDLVLEALRQLPRDIRTLVRFDHIGAPADEDGRRYARELQALTAEFGLADSVTWRGEQASSEALLREIDCLVVASHNEPFSIAVLEALAAGVPVLAADTGGARDLVVAGRSGWFFRSGDAVDLVRVIVKLQASDALCRAIPAAELVRPFTAPLIARRWAEVYAAL